LRRLLLLGCFLGAGALVTACDDGGGSAAPPDTGCGDDEAERLDPDSLLHVFPGAAEPEYLTDPPTSGPHAPSAPLAGLIDTPLSRPEQVGQLEAGVILVQHRGLEPDDLATLDALASNQVVVVPNPDLPAPVVATAWTRKLVCGGVDDRALADLRAFADDHAGGGPGSDADGG
jgi:Protein of unknown function (DUF3105)